MIFSHIHHVKKETPASYYIVTHNINPTPTRFNSKLCIFSELQELLLIDKQFDSYKTNKSNPIFVVSFLQHVHCFAILIHKYVRVLVYSYYVLILNS